MNLVHTLLFLQKVDKLSFSCSCLPWLEMVKYPPVCLGVHPLSTEEKISYAIDPA